MRERSSSLPPRVRAALAFAVLSLLGCHEPAAVGLRVRTAALEGAPPGVSDPAPADDRLLTSERPAAAALCGMCLRTSDSQLREERPSGCAPTAGEQSAHKDAINLCFQRLDLPAFSTPQLSPTPPGDWHKDCDALV